MTSPATMRLVGLLVIVGMVAGCGSGSRDASEVVPANEEVALVLGMYTQRLQTRRTITLCLAEGSAKIWSRMRTNSENLRWNGIGTWTRGRVDSGQGG